MKQFEKSNISRREVSIAAMMSLLPFSLILILVLLINSAQTTQTNQQESNFRDPLVWDSNTLYKNDKESNIMQLSVTRRKRSATTTAPIEQNQQQIVDACQSKMEVITPYYATNSKGKLRTIVNSELMQQAIQVENCVRSQASQNGSKCSAQPDCGCEQKYKWHRLLVLDPLDTQAAKGLFMDWFLFPSSCVCRCKSGPSSNRQFLRAMRS